MSILAMSIGAMPLAGVRRPVISGRRDRYLIYYTIKLTSLNHHALEIAIGMPSRRRARRGNHRIKQGGLMSETLIPGLHDVAWRASAGVMSSSLER